MLRELVESVSDYAIYLLDAEGRVATWNAGAERLKGYSLAEIEGQPLARFFTEEDRDAGMPDRLLATARTEGRVEAEGWRVRKDGTRFWALGTLQALRNEAGELTGYAKVTRDMTERRAEQEALLQSERQFRLLLTGVVDYALYMLDPSGVVSSWNAGAERIKGYAADEIVGRHFCQFYTPEDQASGLPMRALRTAEETGRFEAEGWRMRRDGTRFWASVVIDAIHDDDGALMGFAKITRDITEKRDAQLELQQAHERMGQAQKMEALGQLTGGVAHDFNNLLMVVSGQAQLLRNRLGGDPRTVRSLDAIEASTKRGEDLTRRLLSFSRRQRLQPAAFDLADRLDALRGLIGTSLPPTIPCRFDLPAELWPLEADVSELEVALLNLAVNARDAMPDGGAMVISAQNLSLTGDGDVGLVGDYVAISVADTGGGIPTDILTRIFDPFFTTKAVDKGTGLGLSQVYGFAEQSGGRVTVASKLGQGATFTIYLPRGRTAPQSGQASEGDRKVGRQARILLIEDNPDVADVAFEMLQELGHEVRHVGSTTAALSVLAEGPTPDLVFSDIVMAGDLDGVGLARRLRHERPDLPVLLATGYSQTAERIGDEFPILRKPYKLGDLGHAIEDVLGRAARRGDKLISLDKARRARHGG